MGDHVKFTVSKEGMLEALQKVQSIVSPRTTLPILSNVLLRAEEGRLWLSTTDLEHNGQLSPSGSAHSSPDADASSRAREPWREPMTFTPASSTPAADSRRVNLALEGLDALDLDELLARLEAGEKL